MCQLTPRYILNSHWLQTMFFSTLKWLHSTIFYCIYNEEKIWFVLRLNKIIRWIQNVIRSRKNRSSLGRWKTIKLLLPRKNIVAWTRKNIFLYLNTSDSLNKFSWLWRTILCGITNGFLMVFSAEDVTRGNGLSSYISPIKWLMIQYDLMIVTLPDTIMTPMNITLKYCL